MQKLHTPAAMPCSTGALALTPGAATASGGSQTLTATTPAHTESALVQPGRGPVHLAAAADRCILHQPVPPGELILREAKRGGAPEVWRSRHPVCPGLRAAQGLKRVAPLRYATPAPRWLHRGAAVVSFAIPAMARPLCPAQPGHGPIERQCPIRFVSVHLLGTAGQLLRVLFLDREGHISAQPHFVPREVALILAANQQRVRGP